MDRSDEMVEVSMTEISNLLNLADTPHRLWFWDVEGEQVPYQVTYDDKVVFPVTVAANGTSIYRPFNRYPRRCGGAWGRQYPERLDDMAWRTISGGFRAYGPALQGVNAVSATTCSRSEALLHRYWKTCMPRNWMQTPGSRLMNCARQTRRQPMSWYAHSPSYRPRLWHGLLCSRSNIGSWVSALMVNDTIIYPWCYKTWEVLDNGPLRFTVKLGSIRWLWKGILRWWKTSDYAGCRFSSEPYCRSYSNLKESLPIVTGIVLHEPDGAVVADAAGGYMTYVDPTTGPDNGKIFMGPLSLPLKEAKTVLFPRGRRRCVTMRTVMYWLSATMSRALTTLYYWGFAWDRADIKTAEAWNRYMADFAQKVRNPMTVSIR